MMQRGYLIHCMPGWRALFCVLDNLTPHRVVADKEDPGVDLVVVGEVAEFSYTEGRLGFGWVCRLHDWAGGTRPAGWWPR